MSQLQSSNFDYEIYSSSAELKPSDAALLLTARDAIDLAYAPYSNFRVGAAAELSNGETVRGANQENAAFPAGLCAERVVLGTVTSQYPGSSISAMAISYINQEGEGDQPISPCGICRQSLSEFSDRFDSPIRLILGGVTGPVYVIQDARQLLPLYFSSKELL